VVWLLGCPCMIGNCLGMLVMLRYIYIYNGLPCMCDKIHEMYDGYRGSLACEINE